jgi:hypothetical protein
MTEEDRKEIERIFKTLRAEERYENLKKWLDRMPVALMILTAFSLGTMVTNCSRH